MIVVFKNIKHQNVLVADLEYDNDGLMQFAGLLFEQVNEKEDMFQLSASFNFFVKKDKVNKYAEKYTGITLKFLQENGIEIEAIKASIESIDIDLNDTLFVSHGSKNDRMVLKKSGITDLPSHSFCTYKNAKRILNRDKHLKLKDVAVESGFYLGEKSHDAFLDAWATVAVFSFLNKIEHQKSS